MVRHTVLALLASAAAAHAQAQAQASAPDRGALLYETHCIGCHTEQMHWRDKRLARDWDGLRAQVVRWQDVQGLHWTEDDITAVARHLNGRIYRFSEPSRLSQGPLGPTAGKERGAQR